MARKTPRFALWSQTGLPKSGTRAVGVMQRGRVVAAIRLAEGDTLTVEGDAKAARRYLHDFAWGEGVLVQGRAATIIPVAEGARWLDHAARQWRVNPHAGTGLVVLDDDAPEWRALDKEKEDPTLGWGEGDDEAEEEEEAEDDVDDVDDVDED